MALPKPKDTIYAVLSLAKDREGIVPNYSKTLVDICIGFVKSCVDASQSLDIICRHWVPKPSPDDLMSMAMPSWIPSISGAAFGEPERALNGRVEGDSLVGHPDRKIYNAAFGYPTASPNFGASITSIAGIYNIPN